MSIEPMTAETGILENLYDSFAEQGIDCDIAMPDYCPDIMRILKCSVTNSITNSKISGDRATVDGSAKIRIIYTDEKTVFTPLSRIIRSLNLPSFPPPLTERCF